MGITGLLPFLKKIHSPVNVAQFRGSTVAIDAYCWLHKGAFSCADKLALGEDTDQYVHYCMKYVNYLLKHDLKPILVFDGCHLPSKREVEKTRREKREMNRKRAAQLMREGRRAEARECMQRSVDITPQMALKLMTTCRQRGVDCIVAPYEADAQLAYLAKAGIAQLVITEDSDLLLFGCPRVIFKMDYNGNGILIEQSRLNEVTDIQNGFYTFDRFRYMCILSGCDYLASLPNIGLAKACKVFKTTHQQDIRQVLKKLPMYLKGTGQVPEDYIEGFVKANNTFLYQLCFDPVQRKLVPLNPYPPEVDPEELSYCGPPMPDNIALQVALGNIDHYTKERIHSFDPDKPQPCPKGGQARPPVAANHQSVWSPRYRQRSAALASVQPGETPPPPSAWKLPSPRKRHKSSPRKKVMPGPAEPEEATTDAELLDIYSKTVLSGASRERAAVSHRPLPSLPALPSPGSPGKHRPQKVQGAINEASPRKRNIFALSPNHKKRRFDLNMTKEVRSRYFMSSETTSSATPAEVEREKGETRAGDESGEEAGDREDTAGTRSEAGDAVAEDKENPDSQWEEPSLPRLVSRRSSPGQSRPRPTQRTSLEHFARTSTHSKVTLHATSPLQAGSPERNSQTTASSPSTGLIPVASDSKSQRDESHADISSEAKASKRKSSEESLQDDSEEPAAKKKPASAANHSSGRKFSGSAFQWSSFARPRKEGLMASQRSLSREAGGTGQARQQPPSGDSSDSGIVAASGSSSDSFEDSNLSLAGSGTDCITVTSRDSTDCSLVTSRNGTDCTAVTSRNGTDCTPVTSRNGTDCKMGKEASDQKSSSSAAEDVTVIPSVSWTDFLSTVNDSPREKSTDSGSDSSSDFKAPLGEATLGSWRVDSSKARSSNTQKETQSTRLSADGGLAGTAASKGGTGSSLSSQPGCPGSESSQQMSGLSPDSQKWRSGHSPSQDCSRLSRASPSSSDLDSPGLHVVDLTQDCEPSSQSSSGSPFSSQRSTSSPSSARGVHKGKKACRVPGLSKSRGKLVPDKGQLSIKDLFAKQRQ